MQNLMCEQITVNAEMIAANLACVAARLAEALDRRPIWFILSFGGIAPASLREGRQTGVAGL
ncbi:hypothetical protein RRF57_005193 [Xylaria bambusicola]|uniref:Uncharacterized protein n=1 Tax=Xylaria bambusicola TaxID=326684 RepID=A0AAN7ULL4_9PEZI